MRFWESKLGSTSYLSHEDPGAGTGGSRDGVLTRPPAPAPCQLPHSARPRPVLGSSFLPCPFPSAESYKSGEITVPGASEPLISIAVSREEAVHRAVGTVPLLRRGSSALGLQAFALAVPGLRSLLRRLSHTPGLATRFWSSEFRKVARQQIRRLPAEVRGRWGAARGPCAPRKV